MAIDRDLALGTELPRYESSWTEDDVILYHLGIGAGVPAVSPRELAYTYETQLKVLPSFATTLPFPVLMGLGDVPGLDFNFALLLHGEQSVELAGPIPTSAKAVHQGRVAEIWDKGKGALVVLEVETRDVEGSALFTNRYNVFLRGEGGFGGPPGPGPSHRRPDRPADHVVESPTLEQQALLYRLSGDKNPLHIDPTIAALAGFERPILHGLCSFGIVGKAAIDTALDGRVTGVSRYEGRFTGAVMPGETIVTSMWSEPGRVVVEAVTKERQSPVMGNAALHVSEEQ